MVIGPVAAAMKSMIDSCVRSPEANPSVNRLDPASRNEVLISRPSMPEIISEYPTRYSSSHALNEPTSIMGAIQLWIESRRR